MRCFRKQFFGLEGSKILWIVKNIFIQSFQRCHYGLVTVSDGKCRPQTTRLKLSTDTLILQREEFIFPDDDDGYPVDNKVNHILDECYNSN